MEETAQVQVPDGVVPVFLSTATQQIFNVIGDTDVTSDNPYKLIQKDQLLQDIQLRAAVSDFQPLKQKILIYPSDELLLVYDYEFKYEQNFYLCVTEEAKELVLNPPKDEAKEEGEEGGEDEFNEPIPTTPIPQEWIPLGSDKEINETLVTHSRPLLKYMVSKKRRYFANECQFYDYSSSHRENYIEVTSAPPPSEEIKEIHKMEIETGVQAVPEVADKINQSKWCHPVNASTQYQSRTFIDDEANEEWNSELMNEFLNKVTPRVELCLQQNEIIDIFPDDYMQLAEDDGIVADKSDTNLKEYQSFTDLKFSKDKVVTCIDWHPTIKGIIAVSCGEPYCLNERIELSFKLMHSNSLVIIWSFTDPIHPQLFLEAPEDILCFKFNPSNPNLIAGGCINGQIVIWDITEYQDRLNINRSSNAQDYKNNTLEIFNTDDKLDHAPIVSYTASSAIDSSHTKSVTDISWIPEHIEVCHKTFKIVSNTSNFSSQLISSGLDGAILFWDLRPLTNRKPNQNSKAPPTSDPNSPFYYLNVSWKPFYKITVARSNQPGSYAVSNFSIKEHHLTKPKPIIAEEDNVNIPMPHELTITHNKSPLDDMSTQLCFGSEEGEFVFINWLPIKDPETGKPASPRPEYFFPSSHSGSMGTVERSPFFRDIILTVGGWNFSIWKQGISSDALLKSGNSQVVLTGGAWSPTRPGVFFICKHNGNIDIWDLMDRSHVPSLAQNISSLSITYIVPWSLSSKQLMLAAGDSAGTLHILETPWSLSHPSTGELSIMESFFEREVKRLAFVGERASKREKEKKILDEQKKKTDTTEEVSTTKEDTWEEIATKEYEEYLKLENQILIELGFRQSEEEN